MHIVTPYCIKGYVTELTVLSLGIQHVVLIDTEDLVLLDGRAISMQRTYVNTYFKSKATLLHRLIKPEWPMIDHINQVPSDNRKINLRTTNHSANKHNSNTGNTTGFQNVTREGNLFRAFLRHNKVPVGLGRFNTPEEANDAVILYKINNNLL